MKNCKPASPFGLLSASGSGTDGIGWGNKNDNTWDGDGEDPDDDGTWDPSISLSNTQGAKGTIFIDVNHDCLTDILIWSDTLNEVFVYLNNGNGTYTLSQTLQGQSGFASGGIAAGDFNNDGNPDVVMTNNDSNSVSVFLGNGSGTFNLKSSPAVGTDPDAVAVGDFNNDGKLDIVTSNEGNDTLSILLGNGDGTFTLKSSPAVGNVPVSLAVGEFNNDKNLDIAALNSFGNAGSISILLGNGDGTFTAGTPVSLGSVGPSWIAAGDVNGDKKVDLVTANLTTGTISVFLGSGNGNFNAAPGVPVGTAGVNAQDVTEVQLADLNQDGHLDLVFANSFDDNISVVIGNGDGSFASGSTTTTGTRPDAVASADFNGDGKPDLAVANWVDGTASILLGDGKGNFTLKSTPAVGTSPVTIATGDFNGDGKQDLVVGDEFGAPSLLYVLLGNGDGTFTVASTPSVPFTAVGIAVGDFNGDKKLDLAVANEASGSAEVTMLLGNGDGTFTTGATVTGFLQTTSVASGDFNGDGKLDLAVADSSINTNKVYVYLGRGNGTFNSPTTVAGDGNTDLVAAGDFNGDKKLDLAIADAINSNTVSIALGNGNGTFAPIKTFTTGENPQALVVGDFTGDGKLDAATLSTFDSISVVPGNGDGTLATYMGFAITPGSEFDGPYGLASADFTNNGGLGIAATAAALNNVAVLVNNPVVFLSTSSLAFPKQTVGTSSSAKVQLNNSGAASLTFSSFSISGKNPGDFSETNTCGSKLGSAKQCQITVTFTPKATGSRSASLSIKDSAKGSPQVITLSGIGS